MGSAVPKQYLKLDDKTILEHTLSALLRCDQVGSVIVAISAGDTLFETLPLCHHPRISHVIGGAERSDSVREALTQVKTEYVMVHDAARPFISLADLQQLVASCVKTQECGGILCAKSTDTLKMQNAGELRIAKTLPREQIYRALTPQLFKTALLKEALSYVQQHQLNITDDAQAMELMGHQPLLVLGDPHNFKITTPTDLLLARALLSYQLSDAADSLK